MVADPPRLVLMTADTVGGVWMQALELAATLGSRGVRVSLATMGAPLSPTQRDQARALPMLDVHESAFRLEWMEGGWDDVARAGDWLLELERRLRPDVVHLNQFAFGALAFEAPKLVVAHSCVLSWWRAVRGEPAPRQWDRYRDAVAAGLAGAALAGAPTRAMLDSLRGNYGHRGRGVVLPNGRSPERWRGGDKQPFVFAAGRLWDPAKNLAALESVAPRLGWPVQVAGSVRHPDGWRCEPRHVSWLGELPPDALAERYAHASIFAAPARYEPFGLSVLEAALSGCALVLGDIASLREVWGAAALYVPADDADALQAALARLTEDPRRRARLAAAARLRAERYTPDAMADGYLAAYAQAAAAAPPTPDTAPRECRCAS